MFEGALDGDSGEFLFRGRAERAAGRRQPKAADGADRFAVQALEDRRVFAVHGQHVDAVLARLAHDDFAGHDQDFLGSDGNVFAGANRGQRRGQARRADDGDQHNVRSGQGGELHETLGAGEDLGACAQGVAQFTGLGRVGDANRLRPMLAGLLQQRLHVVARPQPEQADAVRQILGHFDGAGAD